MTADVGSECGSVADSLPHRLESLLPQVQVTFPRQHEPATQSLKATGLSHCLIAQAFPAPPVDALVSPSITGTEQPLAATCFQLPLTCETPDRSATPRPPRPPRRVYTNQDQHQHQHELDLHSFPIQHSHSQVTLTNFSHPCSPDLHRSPSPSSTITSDSVNSRSSTISSSRASLVSETILTPGQCPSDESDDPSHFAFSVHNMTSGTFSTSPPQSIVCTTDDEMAAPVWLSSSLAGRHHNHNLLPFAANEPKDAFTSPHNPHRAFSAVPESSSRSMSPSSFCSLTDSSPAPASSSDHSYHSEGKPAIRITESSRGAPKLSFTHGGESLLGPPLPPISRAKSPSGEDSASTVTGREGRHGASPSPTSRKRRLDALRNLVSNLDFAQPWSVIEQAEQANDGLFWSSSESSPPPQLNRLSLGSSFDAEEVSILASESVVSLPSIDGTDKRNSGTWPRSRRYSRSMGALVDSLPRETVAKGPKSRRSIIAPERPVIPPRTSSRPVHTPTDAVNDKKPLLRLNLLDSPRPTSLHRNGSALRKSTSQRPMGSPRELPRPRQRKESFGVVYSGYSKSLRPTTPRPRDNPTSWRQSLHSDYIYDQVAGGPDGAMEVKRQEIMWEMSETEAAFVRSCRDVIRLFVAPLREAQGDWMKGLPAGVCDLFEALEAIHITHTDISTAQQIARRRSDVVEIAAFVDQFETWVARLAVHERYLMLFNTVVAQIEEAARDQASIFGEFLRLQTRDKALGSLSLGSMLLKPVQRITKYTLFLKRLLAATPSTHKSNRALLGLIASTESIIGRLEACKAREDDFLQLISLEERLDDLPGNFDIAIRGRRLLAHAQVVRASRESLGAAMGMPRSVSVRSLKATMAAVPSFSSMKISQPSSRTPSRGPSRAPSRGASTDSELPPLHSRGLTTSPSSGTSSINSISGAASPAPHDHSLSRSPSYSSSLADTSRPNMNIKLSSFRKPRRDEILTMLVFNDMIALAAPVPDKNLFKSRKAEAAHLRILSVYDGGLGTVEELRELEASGGNPRSIALTIRSPGGNLCTSVYSVSPQTSLSRRAQRSAALPGRGLETLHQLVVAIQTTRSSGLKEDEV
ncbi:hypothetical protein CcaverHIS641_0206090 [Cutaneotrichosporon cavernicola]|nr:hypothetical protein CcaverHIS641_0206090 [Cutaneotrichosporon cavernicola]